MNLVVDEPTEGWVAAYGQDIRVPNGLEEPWTVDYRPDKNHGPRGTYYTCVEGTDLFDWIHCNFSLMIDNLTSVEIDLPLNGRPIEKAKDGLGVESSVVCVTMLPGLAVVFDTTTVGFALEFGRALKNLNQLEKTKSFGCRFVQYWKRLSAG